MANIPEEVRETLSSPGAKHIARALRSFHKSQWQKLRKCSPDELRDIQSVMSAIESLPVIIDRLANQHLDVKKDKDPSLWFRVPEWLKCIRWKH